MTNNILDIKLQELASMAISRFDELDTTDLREVLEAYFFAEKYEAQEVAECISDEHFVKSFERKYEVDLEEDYPYVGFLSESHPAVAPLRMTDLFICYICENFVDYSTQFDSQFRRTFEDKVDRYLFLFHDEHLLATNHDRSSLGKFINSLKEDGVLI